MSKIIALVGALGIAFSVVGCGKSQEDPVVKRSGYCTVGGFNDAFVKAVKKQVRFPSSFKIIQTQIDPVGVDGNHRIAMTFQTDNGSSGTIEMTAVGLVDNATCSHATVTMLG